MELNLNIDSLAEGAVKEKIQTELARIAENILDLNTDAKKARTLNIKISFVPNDRRSEMATRIDVTSKLAPSEEAETTFLIGRDYNTGMMAMNELQSGQEGQMFFDPEDSKLKTDIGQDVEEIEAEELAATEESQEKTIEAVIDFNQRKVKGE